MYAMNEGTESLWERNRRCLSHEEHPPLLPMPKGFRAGPAVAECLGVDPIREAFRLV